MSLLGSVGHLAWILICSGATQVTFTSPAGRTDAQYLHDVAQGYLDTQRGGPAAAAAQSIPDRNVANVDRCHDDVKRHQVTGTSSQYVVTGSRGRQRRTERAKVRGRRQREEREKRGRTGSRQRLKSKFLAKSESRSCYCLIVLAHRPCPAILETTCCADYQVETCVR